MIGLLGFGALGVFLIMLVVFIGYHIITTIYYIYEWIKPPERFDKQTQEIMDYWKYRNDIYLGKRKRPTRKNPNPDGLPIPPTPGRSGN